ncbi:MAG: transcription antitermination factor NusB [Bacteroidales bacterium]
MISRRLIRIKVLQILYAYTKKSEGFSSIAAEKELFHSIEKFYDLYLMLLLLLSELSDMEKLRIELRRNKNIKSAGDEFPCTHFVDNAIIHHLGNNRFLNELKENRKLNWKAYPDLVKGIYNDFLDTDLYSKYISLDKTDFNTDRKLIVDFYSEFLAENQLFNDFLEEENIYWNDDIGFAIIMVIKTIESIKPGIPDKKLLPLFKNEDDREFARKILRSSIINRADFLKIIEKHVENWDTERIAQLDLLILQIAIAELLEFSSIPVKVTLDEFIEISKFYSTERSKIFINGLLDKIIKDLKSQNRLNKTGRGLKE